jgi:serine protease
VSGDGEFNPVRTYPHTASLDEARIILKLRRSPQLAAAGEAAQSQLAAQRIAALTARTGVGVRATRAITAELHALQLDLAVQTRSAALARLRSDPEVENAVIDQRRYPHAVPNDPLFSAQWYLQPSSAATTPSAVDAETAWDTTTGSTGVVIADIDTGVRFEHPDLVWAATSGRLLPGYTFIADAFVANDGDTLDADASDPGDWVTTQDLSHQECKGGSAGDSSWHGTRVSGILGALSNNGAGIAGMTWSTWILPVRALGKCGGLDSDIISGMLWAAGIHVNGVPDNPYPAQIENLSLGATGSCATTVYPGIIAQLAGKGVLVVASAGNEGGPVDLPANCPGVVGVAGIRHAGTKVGFSSLGPEIALSAPAGNCVNTAPGSPCLYPITSTTNEGATGPGANSYTDQISNPNLGTSFAAPIVSGTAALMLAVNGNLSPAQLIARLKKGTLPFPQTSVGEPANAQPPMCHVPKSATDLQTTECICTLDGKTCGAGMTNASLAVVEALRPIAAVSVPASVQAGMNVALDASGSAAACHHTVAGYQWVSSDPAGHPVTNNSGSSTSVTAPASGSFRVTLTVTDDAGKMDTATVTVNSTTATTAAPASAGTSACLAAITVPPHPVTVSISPASGTVTAGSGGTLSFAATVAYTLNSQVTWQVNGMTGGSAALGTISASGIYTAPATVPAPSTVTVAAVSVADPTRSGTATVSVVAPVGMTGGGGGGGGEFDDLSLIALMLTALARASRVRALLR